MKAAILAGGKGTRLASVTGGLPKAMAPIGGVPVLEHLVRLLVRHGVTDIVLLLGYQPGPILTHFGDGSRFGARITTRVEPEPLGSAGGLKEGEDLLDEDFFLLNCDVMMDMDLEALFRFHRERGAVGTLVVHPNDHPHDSDLVSMDGQGRVTAFHAKPHAPGIYHRNLVNAGAHVFSPAVFKFLEKGKKADLSKALFPKLVGGGLYAYNTGEYLKDMGTPERLTKVDGDYRSGRITRWNRRNPRPAVFLDRDGVLNRFEEGAFITRPEDLKLLPGVAEAIHRLNQSDFLAIVATNQPALARNLMQSQDLEAIHGRMEHDLSLDHGKLDAIYHCPHHPDKGFPEENPALKIPCTCRKPAPGMLLSAQKDFNIDLSRSFMVGDHERDILAGRQAGCRTVGLGPWKDKWVKPDHGFPDLRRAVDWILAQNP